MKTARPVEVVVVSDVHLGTYGCKAKELLRYLKSIDPKILVLNGDVVDIWQFSKRYWPKSHMKLVRYLLKLITKGGNVYYIPGNHDETLRRFAGFSMGNFQILNKVVLRLPTGERAWIFHGDVFDVTMQYSKWLARLGAIGYDALIGINTAANFCSARLLGKGKISLSKKIKSGVKSAVKFINCFEEVAAGIGIERGYNYVICGHIHHPEMRFIKNHRGCITYLNSGDWVENLTALEFNNGKWNIYQYDEDDFVTASEVDETEQEPNNQELFHNLLREFKMTAA